MRTSEQTTTLLAALITAHGAFPPILKEAIGQVGSSREYRYADLAAILDAITPPLLHNNLAILQSIDAESSSLITRLAHVSGEWIESVYPLKLEQTPQAFGSALTYGRRYSIQSLLCLAAADDDAETTAKAKPATTPKAKQPKLITEAQRKRLFALASGAGWTHPQIKAYLERRVGIAHTTDIRVDQYDALCDVFGTPFEPEGEPA